MNTIKDATGNRDRHLPLWWYAGSCLAWLVGIQLFIIVVLLLKKWPAWITELLDYRWCLWIIGVLELFVVIALRFVRAWHDPIPATASATTNIDVEMETEENAAESETAITEKKNAVLSCDQEGATGQQSIGRPVWPERLFSWLFAYPLFTMQIIVFWAISWLGFGEGLGLPDLVWADAWWERFFSGLAISLLFGNALFVRAMLDLRPGNKRLQTPPGYSLFCVCSDLQIRRVGAFLLKTWIPALLVFYVFKRFASSWNLMDEGGSMASGLVAGVLLTVVLACLYEWKLQNWGLGRRLVNAMPAFRGDAATTLPSEDRSLHGFAGLITIVLPAGCISLFLFEHQFFDAVWSPVWLFCIMLAVFNSIYGFVTFQLAGLQYVLLVLVVDVMFLANLEFPGKMTFPGLDDPKSEMPNLNDPPPNAKNDLKLIKTPDILKTFHKKWGDGIGTGTAPIDRRKPKLVIIATTGGGIQAAVWTAVVLEGLEKQIPGLAGQKAPFRDHIRLITGASGGMQAAALYVADFKEHTSNYSLDQQLARDSLWPTIQTMLAHDLPGLAWPSQFQSDRGRTLENAWTWNCRPWSDMNNNRCEPPGWWDRTIYKFPPSNSPLDKTFWELRADEESCDRPSLIFSPMLVEDCRRVLISNLDLDWFAATTASHLNPNPKDEFKNVSDPNTISIPAIELWKYFPWAREKFKVVTAARMSATFPFVGPAVSLPSNPPRRVVDAGYFDNFGINLAAMWLYRYRVEIEAETSGVVIVEIRAYKRRAEKLKFEGADEDKDDGSQAELFTWAASELSSPLEAIINLYARGAYFRNDQLLRMLDGEFNIPPRCALNASAQQKFFTSVVFECGQPAALSWTLPKRDAKTIREQFDKSEIETQVQSLRAWFGTGGTK